MSIKPPVVFEGREIGKSLLVSGRTYLPVRALSEALGVGVEWDNVKKEVLLTSGSVEPEPVGEIILPQKWVEEHERLPSQWFEEKAPSLLREIIHIEEEIRATAKYMGVSEKLLVTRMQLEQRAITYAWDESSHEYSDYGKTNDEWKAFYLCGVDKTDSGPRDGGWFTPKRQILACAARFKYWYRGREVQGVPNWLGLEEDPKFAPGVPVTRSGVTIVPGNQISADCLRYTTGMQAQKDLRRIAEGWFPEDF